MVGVSTGFHRAKLLREELRVATPDTEDDHRARIPDHCRSHRVRTLIGAEIFAYGIRAILVWLSTPFGAKGK
jgi:hypothetical protein